LPADVKGLRSIHAADLDGDGDLDVLSASSNDGKVAWYRNELHDASARFRNAGDNPVSYTTTLPVLGGVLTGTVDLGHTTGHTTAWLVGYVEPLTHALPGGQILLVNTAHPDGELLGFAPVSGPVSIFQAGVPSIPGLVGFQFSAQALHIGGVIPFALSNARDFTLGF